MNSIGLLLQGTERGCGGIRSLPYGKLYIPPQSCLVSILLLIRMAPSYQDFMQACVHTHICGFTCGQERLKKWKKCVENTFITCIFQK